MAAARDVSSVTLRHLFVAIAGLRKYWHQLNVVINDGIWLMLSAIWHGNYAISISELMQRRNGESSISHQQQHQHVNIQPAENVAS